MQRQEEHGRLHFVVEEAAAMEFLQDVSFGRGDKMESVSVIRPAGEFTVISLNQETGRLTITGHNVDVDLHPDQLL